MDDRGEVLIRRTSVTERCENGTLRLDDTQDTWGHGPVLPALWPAGQRHHRPSAYCQEPRMSWDATLTDDRGHTEGDWNYTHNCNAMANLVLYEDYDATLTTAEEVLGIGRGRPSQTWWKQLDGLSGPDGAALLDRIIKGLEADPERFRPMSPDNGWGDFDSFVKVLTEMRNAVPEWPTTWSTSG